MKSFGKKLVVYSMVGIMQIGFGASVVAASPIHIASQGIVQLDDRHHDNDRQREHDRRMREENARHEREMRRHHGESERAWHERQERERERHEEALRQIGAFLLGYVIGGANN